MEALKTKDEPCNTHVKYKNSDYIGRLSIIIMYSNLKI